MEILLVEDTPQYQESITRHLQQAMPLPFNLRVFGSVELGVKAIEAQAPDLLLLDINLPDGTGFDVLEKVGMLRNHFKVIFISAHDNYAIKAFKCSAIDYVLKPINPLDFQNALTKAIKANAQERALKMNALSSNLMGKGRQLQNIILKDADSIHAVEVESIIRCESANNYTTFFLKQGKQIVVSTTLKEYDKILKDQFFFRSHQSHLVNLKFFDRYEKRDGGYIVLKDETIVPLSRGRKDLLMEKLTEL